MAQSTVTVLEEYIFGASTEETQRLQRQAQQLAPSTRQFLKQAGIEPGMKVLDIGSGAGDVSLLLAEAVGPTGQVVGLDRNPAILETARARVNALELDNISFVEGEIGTVTTLDADFDAVVGRYIVQHLPKPAEGLRHLARYLRPGGIMAFQEADFTHLGTCVPYTPLFAQVGEWARRAMEYAGVDTQIGLRLYHIFLEAGLPAPQIHCEAFIGAGADWAWYDVIVERVRSMLPVIEKYGIATAEEVEITTLAQRCRDAVVSQHAVAMATDLVSAWTRLPSSDKEG